MLLYPHNCLCSCALRAACASPEAPPEVLAVATLPTSCGSQDNLVRSPEIFGKTKKNPRRPQEIRKFGRIPEDPPRCPGAPTSASRILRKALAMAGSRPTRSKLRLFSRSNSKNPRHLSSTSLPAASDSDSSRLMATEKLRRKLSRSHCVAADVRGPSDEYAPPY